MSVLSTITGSLPNVLNLLQGKWDVQYKIGKQITGELGWLQELRDDVVSAVAWLNGLPNPDDGFKWKSLDFDSFISMNEDQETNIMSSPIEGGAFRSVNKVRKPKTIKVTLAKAGIGYGIEDSLAEIKMLTPLARYNKNEIKRTGLNSLVEDFSDWVVSGLASFFGNKEIKIKDNSIPMEFRIITPFDMITDLNLIKFDYAFKKDNGRNMLLINLTFQEIIEKTGKRKKYIKNPTNSATENIGRLSAQGEK